MQSMVTVRCAWCGKKKHVIKAEYNRQRRKGVDRFFCNSSCVAKKRNSERPDLKVEVVKRCPYCKCDFITLTGFHSATFCSRACASAGSVTEARRRAGRKVGLAYPSTTKITAAALRAREAWKYKQLKRLLLACGEHFRFEHPVGNYVFDLALKDHKVLVEFDSAYHSGEKQKVVDRKKAKVASKKGWAVVHVKTEYNAVIPPKALYKILAQLE